MAGKTIINDYVTPIRKILTGSDSDKREHLRRLIYSSRKIHSRHLAKQQTIDQTVEKLLATEWLSRIRRFDPEEWRTTADGIWKAAERILHRADCPEIILYPSFNMSNGRVYKIDRKPIIACSPDFPHSSGRNLKVLLDVTP